MNSTPTTVIAQVSVLPGSEDAVCKIITGLLTPTRCEAGCLNYDLHRSAEDPTRFLLHENWRTREDLDRHLQSPHVAAALEKCQSLLAEPLRLTFWTRIG